MYSLACNFDWKLLEGVISLNLKYSNDKNNRVSSFFGSIRNHAYLSARPYFQLKNIKTTVKR